MRNTFVLILCALGLALPADAAKKKTDEAIARELFNKAYEQVFGAEGSSFDYSVNIVGIYKTQGHIIYKGKKNYFSEKRYSAWVDGVTAYKVDKKKQTVDIYDANDSSRDKHMSKFKYDINNFTFSYTTKGDYYELTAKVKNAKMFGIRSLTAKVRRSNLYPVSITVSLPLISATVKISNFTAGNISEKTFVFPAAQYKDYETTDHR